MKNWSFTDKLILLAIAWLLLGGKIPWSIGGSTPPFKTDKLAVLVVEESADRAKYTADQMNVILATDAKSVKAAVQAKGGLFQLIDLDTADNLENSPPWVKEAITVKRESVPWVVAATPSSGFSVPLTTEADVLTRVGGLR